MNKQQAWDEWHKGILGNKAPDIKLSSHGKAFSAGWEAKAKQAPTGEKLEAFCSFIGSEPIENDGGWSLEVWNAAWEACEKEQEAKKPVETSAPPS
jgi:hypothetical protein